MSIIFDPLISYAVEIEGAFVFIGGVNSNQLSADFFKAYAKANLLSNTLRSKKRIIAFLQNQHHGGIVPPRVLQQEQERNEHSESNGHAGQGGVGKEDMVVWNEHSASEDDNLDVGGFGGEDCPFDGNYLGEGDGDKSQFKDDSLDVCGFGGEDCLFDENYLGEGDGDKSQFKDDSLDDGGDEESSSSTNKRNCHAPTETACSFFDNKDEDVDVDMDSDNEGGLPESQSGNSWTPPINRLTACTNIITPPREEDPGRHFIVTTEHFLQRDDQSLTHWFPEVPLQLRPKWGNLHQELYTGLYLKDIFTAKGQNYTLNKTEQFGKLCKQDSSGPKREHGYISLIYDGFFVDRIYYLLHGKERNNREIFWDTVVLQKKNIDTLKLFRKVSINLIKEPKLKKQLDAAAAVGGDSIDSLLNHCPFELLLQVYANIYHIPAAVFQHNVCLKQKERFGTSYTLLAKSSCHFTKPTPYIILLHDREIKNAGNPLKTSDLFLPAPDVSKKKNRGRAPGHALCYPVDTSQNYIPYYEYQRAKVETDVRAIPHLFEFRSCHPLVNLKTLRDDHKRFHDENKLCVSYLLERAMLEAFIPFDGAVRDLTSGSAWVALCLAFLSKAQEAYHQETQPISQGRPLHSRSLQDPKDLKTLAFKLFFYSRMIMRRIVLVDLDTDNRPTQVILQEPQPSVDVDWPLLCVGMRNNEGTHPYVFYPGKICRLALAGITTSSHHYALTTPPYLEENKSFAEIEDVNTGIGVTCNFDAISVYANDWDVFGKTFAVTESRPIDVCDSSPCVNLNRFMNPHQISKSRLTVYIYTAKPGSTDCNGRIDHSYSLCRNEARKHTEQKTVPLTKFPSYVWGTIVVSSFTFHICLTMLEFGRSNEQEEELNFLKLQHGNYGRGWKHKSLIAFAEILNLADAEFDARVEHKHTTMNSEYNSTWEAKPKPTPERTGGDHVKAYIKLDGVGFSSLCRRVKQVCLEIKTKKRVAKNNDVYLMAKKMLKCCIFTAVTPGSKTQNWLANYPPENGADGEARLDTQVFNTCVTVVSNIIPNAMSGAGFVVDLGYNVADETQQHSIFVLNENAAKVVERNLSRNVEIARNYKPTVVAGFTNLLDLWELYKEAGEDQQNEFLKHIVGMEVCVAPKGYAHGCLTAATVNCLVDVHFYDTNYTCSTYYSFGFSAICFANVPTTAKPIECILFDTKEKRTRRVQASTSSESVPLIYSPGRGLGEPGDSDIPFDENWDILCPVWQTTIPKCLQPVAELQKDVNVPDPHDLEAGPFIHAKKQRGCDNEPEQQQNSASSITRNLAPCAYPARSSSPLLSNKIDHIPLEGASYLCGIKNPGLLCYIIAPIQMLISCPPIVQAIQGTVYCESKETSDWGAVHVFQKLLDAMKKAAANAIHPKQAFLDVSVANDLLKDACFNKLSEQGGQQSASEALNLLMEALIRTVPTLREMFHYSTSIQYTCSPCQLSNAVLKNGTSPWITVAVIPTGFNGTEELLTHYFSDAKLRQSQVSEVKRCPLCKEFDGYLAGKISLIGVPPKFVPIELIRTKEGGTIQKEHAKVHVSPDASFDFEGGMVEYELKGMVCHHGPTIQEGHYTSFGCRQRRDGGMSWCQLNDGTVQDFGNCAAFLENHADEYATSVVMLLYQRKEIAREEIAREVRKRSANDGEGDLCSPKGKRACNNQDANSFHSFGMIVGGTREESLECEESSEKNDPNYVYSDDSSYESVTFDDEVEVGMDDEVDVAVDSLLETSDETAWVDDEYNAAESCDIPVTNPFKLLVVNKWPQYGNKRTCGLGTSHFSLQVILELSPDAEVGAVVGLKGPPNGVGSMCVYNSQAKTAEAELKLSRAEAHEIPFLLHSLFCHADLDDHDFIQFACRFVESVEDVQGSLESMKANFLIPSSLRVEYNLSWDPKERMPCNFVPLSPSEVAKAVIGTSLQKLYADRLDLHVNPIKIVMGMLQYPLDDLAGEFFGKPTKDHRRAVQAAAKAMRGILSNTTPNIRATYIHHAWMYMGLMGGRFGAYSPPGLKGLLVKHPYEIKTTEDACEPVSDLGRLLGFHYEIADAALFPDHNEPEESTSCATSALSQSLLTYASHNQPLKSKQYLKLTSASCLGREKCLHKLHNVHAYLTGRSDIRKCWIMFLSWWENATGNIMTREDTSLTPHADRLAALLVQKTRTNDDPFMESFGQVLMDIMDVIIVTYYSDLQCMMKDLDGEFSKLANTKHLPELRTLVVGVQAQRSDPCGVVVSSGNDYAKDEVLSAHDKGHELQYFPPRCNMNVLPTAMFGSTLLEVIPASANQWWYRFPSVQLFCSLNELLKTAGMGVREAPIMQLLDVGKLLTIFHKSFSKTGYGYIWYHPKQRLLQKNILLIDAFEAVFPVDSTLLDILKGGQHADTLGNADGGRYRFLGKSLVDPLLEDPSSGIGTAALKDNFSSFVGHDVKMPRLSQLPAFTSFQFFLGCCEAHNVGVCVCSVSRTCKCTIWDREINRYIHFSLGELKGQGKARNMFLKRAKLNDENDFVRKFVFSPSLIETEAIDKLLMNSSSFFLGLTRGITAKVLMAWRALRIYYLREEANKVDGIVAPANDAVAMRVIQALSDIDEEERFMPLRSPGLVEGDSETSFVCPSRERPIVASQLPISPLVRSKGRRQAVSSHHDVDCSHILPFQRLKFS